MVCICPALEIIDIQAPKLESLTYKTRQNPILRVFNIQKASKLSYANIFVKNEQHFLFVLQSLFNYFPHLEHLRLEWPINPTMELVLGNFPVLGNLKYLEMFPKETGRPTLAAWIPFIGACPRLEKLTLGVTYPPSHFGSNLYFVGCWQWHQRMCMREKTHLGI